jgi:hypothetical protein
MRLGDDESPFGWRVRGAILPLTIRRRALEDIHTHFGAIDIDKLRWYCHSLLYHRLHYLLLLRERYFVPRRFYNLVLCKETTI